MRGKTYGWMLWKKSVAWNPDRVLNEAAPLMLRIVAAANHSARGFATRGIEMIWNPPRPKDIETVHNRI